MTSHILKLIWNRKRANALIITEVFICFLVAFAILTAVIYNYRLYQEPLGFEWQDTWEVSMRTGGNWDTERDQPQVKQISDMLNQQPEIVGAKVIYNTPFRNSRWTSSTDINDRQVRYLVNGLETGGEELLNLELLDGRFFSEADEGQNYTAILVSERFANEVFPGESAVGKTTTSSENIEQGATPTRIVGVFKEFRQLGEFSELMPYVIQRYSMLEGNPFGFVTFMLKMQPDVTAAYEEELMRKLKGIVPGWSYSINNWEKHRNNHHRESMLPLTIFSVVGVFMLLMVALGLFGVLWQNVTRRTQEIGLRKAMGATKGKIYAQITGELLVVALFGMLLAILVLVQFPLLGVIPELDWTTFSLGLGSSIALMLALAMICAFYPSRVATGYTPAAALHYE